MDQETVKEIAAQLRKPSGEYATKIAETMNVSNRLINLNAIDALEVENEDCILEIGMGNGFFVENILAEAKDVKYIGCDYSPEMVTDAKKLNQRFIESKQVTFHLAAIEKLPVSDLSFDKIFTVNTLYFWADVKQTLNEIKRVLKSQGKFFIVIRPRHIMEKYVFTQHNFQMYEQNEVEEILHEAGFNQISSTIIHEPKQVIAGEEFEVQTLIVQGVK